MTDTTERAELVALAEQIDVHVKHGTDAIFGHDDAQTVASALRRLASQDQEPVAWLQSQNGVEIVSKHRLDPDASKFGWTERPLYLSQPPDAGAGKSADVGVGVPCGYALVPIKPTSEMIEAGCEHNPTQWNEGTDLGFAADVANDVYAAMVRSALSHKLAAAEINASAEARLREAYSALCEPRESQASDNLEGALYDIKRLRDVGKPTDDVCIRTIERVLKQLVRTEQALSAHPHASDCDKQEER